jgi:hypothetical protein
MSAEATDTGTGTESGASDYDWTPEQRKLTLKIAVGFAVGTVMAGVVGPIVLTIVIGLLQGYHRA